MSTCCICCPVRDGEKHLPDVLDNMQRLGETFDDYRIVLCYDDSHDKTLEIVSTYMKKNTHIELLVNTHANVDKVKRACIASARNKCLKHVFYRYPDYSFFIMMDCSELTASPLNMELWKRSLERKDWDALSFYSKNYDLWSLSSTDMSYSVWHYRQPDTHQEILRSMEDAVERCREEDLIEVYSAFNGLGVYRQSLFIDCLYDGFPCDDLIPPFLLEKDSGRYGEKTPYFWKKEGEDDQDIEHRGFHWTAIAKNNPRMRVSPHPLFNTNTIIQ